MTNPDSPVASDGMSQALMDLGHALIAEAETRGQTLRLTGSLAVRHHCREAEDVLSKLGREPPGDVDLFSYWNCCDAIEELLLARGYEPDPALVHSREFGVKRLIYYVPVKETKIEVFFDVLTMSHEIDLRGRLQLDFPTVPLDSLLLSKLQIHELTPKDIKDIIALLAVHPLGEPGAAETVDLQHMATVLCQDWGLWHTATLNLRACIAAVTQETLLPATVRTDVIDRLEAIQRAIVERPKSLRWRARSKIGTKARWYEEVGDVDR